MAHSSTKRAKGLSLLGRAEQLSIFGSTVEQLSYIGNLVIGHCSKYLRSIDIIWETALYLAHLFPFIHIVFFHIQWALWIPFPLDPFDYFVRICSLYLLASS